MSSSRRLPFPPRKKNKPSPLPQPSDEDATDSSSSEEEQITPPPPPPPPKSEQHYDESEESSDDGNTEEELNQDAHPVTNPQSPAAALTVAAPALDGERQLVLGTSSPSTPLALTSNRIWQDPMQLLLLREMVGYSEINGKCKVSLSYVSKFHSSLEGSPLLKFTVNQILEKMKRIKKKYDILNGKGKKGQRKGNPLNPELLELSRKLWGEARKGKVRKKVKGDDDDDDERMVWENAMVRLMEEEFYYHEDYTRQKIASMDKSTRDLLEKRWLNRKGKMNTAFVNFRRVETVCLKVLLPS